jgi:hypothetical protein
MALMRRLMDQLLGPNTFFLLSLSYNSHCHLATSPVFAIQGFGGAVAGLAFRECGVG